MRSSPFITFSGLVLVMTLLARVSLAQDLQIDPPEILNDYIAAGDFNQTGDFELWNRNSCNLSVASGVLEVDTFGHDPFIFRRGISDTKAEMTFVEFRIRVISDDGADWNLYWGEDSALGFTGTRRFAHRPEGDNKFHVYQYDLGKVITSRLTDIRLDPGAGAGTQFEVDYIRIGMISADADGDGLPDVVETLTGTFKGKRDAGTDPANADTDGDGFSDDKEVDLGTDPNNANEFPVPALNWYSKSRARHFVGEEIEPNEPSVSGGTPTAFSITPELPTGLNLDITTGTITGRPEIAVEARDYLVTATFPGELSSETYIHLDVRNPLFTYPVKEVIFKTNQTISLKPTFFGPNPDIIGDVKPDLPANLTINEGNGAIEGIPLATSHRTEYVITAGYGNFPAVKTTIAITVLGEPVVVLDPPELLNEFVSVNEFNTDSELRVWEKKSELWGSNSIALKANNGILEAMTTGSDPYFFRSAILNNPPGFTKVELRIKLVANDGGGWQLFWIEQQVIGFAGARSFNYAAPPMDGEFHVLQFELGPALLSPLSGIRIDPGGGPGSKFEVDYLRIGTVHKDSDDDGLSDAVETDTGYFAGPRHTGTNPGNADTDGDGFGDGEEVSMQTDPTDDTSFPVPSITGYAKGQTIYITGQEIEPNDPIVIVEKPDSFRIEPGLPSGLAFDTKTGQITGLSEKEYPATDYVVTANFPGGATDNTTINIRVSRPFVEYTSIEHKLFVGQKFNLLAPTIYGPTPVSFSVSPKLPPGLRFDPVTGEISGFMMEESDLVEYRIIATYENYPESSATIQIQIRPRFLFSS